MGNSLRRFLTAQTGQGSLFVVLAVVAISGLIFVAIYMANNRNSNLIKIENRGRDFQVLTTKLKQILEINPQCSCNLENVQLSMAAGEPSSSTYVTRGPGAKSFGVYKFTLGANGTVSNCTDPDIISSLNDSITVSGQYGFFQLDQVALTAFQKDTTENGTDFAGNTRYRARMSFSGRLSGETGMNSQKSPVDIDVFVAVATDGKIKYCYNPAMIKPKRCPGDDWAMACFHSTPYGTLPYGCYSQGAASIARFSLVWNAASNSYKTQCTSPCGAWGGQDVDATCNAESFESGYGDNKRCSADDWDYACGNNPTSGNIDLNYCLSRDHATGYGWTMVWDAAANGYKASGGPANGAKFDVRCSSAPTYSRQGSNNRCPGDKWTFACGNHPTPAYNRNYCVSEKHTATYNWQMVWDSAAGNYRANCLGPPCTAEYGMIRWEVQCAN